MGVAVGVIGFMMMAARFVDAFTDVAMGQIVDRSRPGKKGKFIEWIRRMCGPVAVASFLMYASWFQDMSMEFKIFWMFFTYLLWGSVFYTGVNIPYGSMASAITADPKERAELSNWRSIGAALAGTIISVVLPIVVYYKDDATAFNGEKKAEIASKGILNYKISTIMFEELEKEVDLKEVFKKGTPLMLNEMLWACGMAVIAQCYAFRGLEVVAAQNISSTI